jgi:hypothetical protein
MANDKWDGKYIEFTDKIINVSQAGPRFTGDQILKAHKLFLFSTQELYQVDIESM